VAKTCGKCHRFIEERLKRSVHGQHGLGQLSKRMAPGGRIEHTPTCTSCHQGHEILDPKTAAFRLQLASGCGNCHTQLSQQYALSMHGQLTELGYAPAAECSDCHGAHEILAVSDPNSTLSAENRRATCMKCHPHAAANFLQFDPHADYLSAERNPLLHFVYTVLMTLLITTFVVFGVHSAVWLVRAVIDVYQHGRPQGIVPGRPGYQRFAPFHRIAHTILLIAFMGLAATGMPLKYSHHPWAKDVAFYLGGFESTSFWHRCFALVTFGCFIAYVVQLVRNYRRGRRRGVSRWKIIFGPDSPIPNFRDLKDFGRMVGWFAGLCRKPTFDRWAYWEKFDFWGALADVVIIGSTGLVLWFPNFFCFFLPGDVLNIAKVIHSTQALLATGFVFAIHFFSVHLRAEKFPADLSMLTGFVSEKEMEEERPDWLERLRREGRLDELRATIPSRKRIWTNLALGYVALAGGMVILIGMVVAGLGS
jgi:cytochrome b subunit of formate dehydrogenase